MHLREKICINCSNNVPCIVADGYYVCEFCGLMQGRCLDTTLTAYSQSFKTLLPVYSRRTRFHKKMLAALRCRCSWFS